MMRNITYGGAAVVASPYAIGIAGSAAIKGIPATMHAYKTASALTQAGIKERGILAGTDLSVQAKSSLACECNHFSLSRTLGIAAVGTVGGTWGAGSEGSRC